MKVTVKIFALLLSILSFTFVGCDSKSNPKAELTPVPPIEPAPTPVPPIEPAPIPMPPIEPAPPVDSGIYFDIIGVDYSAVSVDESNLSSGARQLAAQCAQCHGTYGVAVADWPDLWGSGRQIGKWMQEYQDVEQYIDNVMYLHAIAYTKEEVKLIKEYYEKVTYEGVE